VNDMALTGRLESYTFFTFAEDTAKSPWEPYNVSLGYKPEDSTVTVATSGNPIVYGGGAVAPWTGQGVVDQMIGRINSGSGFGWFFSQTFVIVLIPDCAVDLSSAGYTRKKLQEYFYEHTRVPFEKLNPGTVKLTEAATADGRIRPENAQIFRDNLKPGGKVPVVQTPDDFHIVVAGGSPGYDLVFSYPGPNWAHQTKKISGATLTKAGR
jgi:hypothetical protein